MGQGYFVTGTDTGVGKTTVSCALLRAFAAQGKKAVGMKPVVAGNENGRWHDVEQLIAASNISVTREYINPYAFDSPVSPHIAAQQAGVEIDLAVIQRAYQTLNSQTDVVIVEGAGGFLVPLNAQQTGVDLARALNLPVILVVGMRLGCLNHALLTAQAIKTAGLILAGWVANCIDPQMLMLEENITTLEQRLDCPLLGVMPFDLEMDIQKSIELLEITKLGLFCDIDDSMQFELSHDKRNISGDDLLSDLRRVASIQLEQQVKQQNYRNQGKFGVTTIIRRFGSWNAAVDAAGLETTVERNISNEKLFTALYELWIALGRQPNYSEVQKPACKFHVATFERRFGSWRQALEAFVSYANSENMIVPIDKGSSVVASRQTTRCPDLRLRFKVLQRDRFCCCACGASPSITPGIVLEIDHIKPWSKGGETVIENLQTLCASCNQGKTNDY
ncbi:dethiobiotin synthase [Nitrosomonas sp.]|uniref:dethiobiotin synthase n=1 Tax=Nitrosomonas sp. TaxID=42353 RepID=UPI00341DE606